MNLRLRLSAGLYSPLSWLLLPALCLCAWLRHEPDGSASTPDCSRAALHLNDESPTPAAEIPAPVILCDVRKATASETLLSPELLSLFEQAPAAALLKMEATAEPARSDLRLALYSRLGGFPAQALAEIGRLRSTQTNSEDELASVIESSLIRAGALAEAFDAVRLAPEGKAPEWLALVCTAWVSQEPSQAPRLETLLLENTKDETALHRLYQAWALADPVALLQHASSQPEGSSRTAALRAGLRACQTSLPCEATLAGLRSAISDTEFDHALHDYIVRGDSLVRPTVQALSLAIEIREPALREESLSKALAECAAEDPVAARNFVLKLPEAEEALRKRLLAALKSPPLSPSHDLNTRP